MPYELFGADGYGRRLGLLSAPALVAKAFAPAAIAMVTDHLGPVIALWTCVAIAIIALGATLSLNNTVKNQA